MTTLTHALLQELQAHGINATQGAAHTNANYIEINDTQTILAPHPTNPTTYTLTKRWNTKQTHYDLTNPNSIQQLINHLRHQTSEQPKPA